MAMRKKLILTLLSIAFLFVSKGCIPVEDFGEYWQKGIIDQALEGHWKQLDVEFRSEENYLSFVKSGDHYVCEFSSVNFMPKDMPHIGIRAKTLITAKHRFLMFDLQQYYEDMKAAVSKAASEMGEDVDEMTLQQMLLAQSAAAKGVLQRYSIEEGILSVYMLDEVVLAEQIKSGNVKGRLPAQDAIMDAALSKLDGETVQFLAGLADEPKYWKQVMRYEKIADLKKAMEEAVKYPATEQTPKNTLVNIDLTDLKYFAEGKTHILLRHLQASPEWKVFIEGQTMVCHRRLKQDGLWNDIDSGSHMEFLHEYAESEDKWFPVDDQDRKAPMNERNFQQMKYLFRFEDEPFGYHAVWAKEPHVMKVGPLEGQMNIKLKASNQGIESYLAIGQPGLWFEVFEQTWYEQRKKTRNALQLLKEFLRGIRAAEDEINEVGYASKLMPPGYVKKGNPTLELKWDRGVYRGQAWINPGQQGYVYLRVLNADTREYLSERLIGSPLKEYVGFSKDPTTLFLHKCCLYLREDLFERSFNADFELWFHPSDGGPERKLVSVADIVLPDIERTIDTTRSAQVIDNSGQPISDARVVLYGANKPPGAGRLPFRCTVLETTTTNEDGIFTITWKRPYKGSVKSFDKLFVVAQKDGFSLGAQYFQSLEIGRDKAIVLSKSATVSGKVIDERGQPFHGVEVHVYPVKKAWEDGELIGLMSSTEFSTSITDRDGLFTFDHIPIEAFVEFYAFAEGYLDKFTWNYMGGRTRSGKYEAGAPDIILKMEINSGFTGRVIDRDTGLPVEALGISFEPHVPDRKFVVSSVTTVTNEEGFYSMYCSPGRYIFNNAYPYKTIKREIIVTKGQIINNVDLQVYKTGSLNVKILQKETSSPVVDVEVILRNDKTGETHSARTGDEGIAFFSRPAGPYVVERISKYGKELLNKPVPLTIQPDKLEEREFKFDITAESKGMLVVVTDAEKKPVSGVDIYLLPGNVHLGQTDEAGRSKIVKEDFEKAVVADFGKEYLEQRGIYGEYYIYAQDEENYRAKIHKFYQRTSGRISMVLSDAFDIVGRVIDTAGQPVADAYVFPGVFHMRSDKYQRFGNEDEFLTDDDGFYRLRALPHAMYDGRPYIITAAADGFGQSIVEVHTVKNSASLMENWRLNRRSYESQGRSMPIAVEPGITEIEIRDFVLKDTGLSLSGVVVDTLGRSIANAKVSFTDVEDDEIDVIKTGPNADFEPFVTGPDGKFAFEDLSEGTLKLKVVSEWSPGRFPGAYEFYDFKTQVEAGTENMRIVMTPEVPVVEKPKNPPGGNGLIKVLVTDSYTQGPVSGASVVFEGENVPGAAVNTNSDGLAYMVLPAGKYTLTRSGGSEHHKPKKINVQVEVEEGQTQEMYVEIDHKEGIEGTVFDPEGRPVGGALLEMIPFNMEGGHSYTKGDGKFSITYDPMDRRYRGTDGPVSLIIIHRRRRLAASFKPKRRYEKDVNIILKPAIRIAGKVVDREGVPTEATIKVLPYSKRYKTRGVEFGQVGSNLQGLYEILIPSDLPTDYKYKLSFWANGTSEQYYSLDEIKKKPGESVVKDVVIRGKVYRPRPLRSVR
jgi:protocatechuate 3,4-dioxygenase beta subunit